MGANDSRIDVSIIIPAHNAELTLARAVESTKQFSNRFNVEVWIIENGSSDKTLDIANTLARQYDFVYVTTSETGVSNARNKGLQCCCGQWIMFLDADDYFGHLADQVIAAEIKAVDYDLILFGHTINGKKHPVTDENVSKCFNGAKEVENARVKMLKDPTRYMQVWAKLFRRYVIEKNGLQFDPNLSFAEDSDFTYRYSRFCHAIKFSHHTVYCYSLNPDSAMHHQNNDKTQKYIAAMTKIKKDSTDEPPQIRHAVDFYILMHLNVLMVRDIFAVSSALSEKEKDKRMKRIIDVFPFADAIANVTASECKSLKLLPALFLKWHWYAAAKMMFKVRAKQNYEHEKNIK